MKTLEMGAIGINLGAGVRAGAGRLGPVMPLAAVILIPLAFWLGFAENFEVPKFLVVRTLALLVWAMALLSFAGGPLPHNPASWPIIALAVSAAGSSALSGMPAQSLIGQEGSWQGTANGVAILLGSVAAGRWLNSAGMLKLARGILLAAALMLAYMLIQVLGWDPFPWNPAAMGSHWLFSTLGNPVHLANFLSCAFWLTFTWPFKSAWLNYLMRAVLLSAVLLTRQESALLGAALGAGIFLLIRRDRRGLAGALAAIFALSVFLAAASPWGADLMGARPAMWKGAARLVRVSPLTGIGPGLFYSWFPYVADYAYYLAEPPLVRGDAVSVRLPASAHNELLDVAAGQGLLGLGAYVWAIIAAWRCAGGSLILPAAASLWAVHLVNPSCVATSVVFWLLLVGAAGVGRKERNSRAYAGRALAGRALAGRTLAGRALQGARVAGLLGIAILLLGVVAGLRTGLAQAYRREAGRLAYLGRFDAALHLMEKWSKFASANDPRQAYKDALMLRSVWKREGDREVAGRALKLFGAARAGNPRDVFFAASYAYLQMEVSREAKDSAALAASERLLRHLVRAVPGLLCLRDDLAQALEAQGKEREAREMRASRERLDERGLFRPQGPLP